MATQGNGGDAILSCMQPKRGIDRHKTQNEETSESRKGGTAMKRELGIARCGLACCLCRENDHCPGCNAGDCPGREWCENRKCSMDKGVGHCYACDAECKKGMLAKIKPYGFTLFAKRYGAEALLDCLERNEQAGVVYHREGITGDYDGFEDVETLMEFIRTGKRKEAE